MCRDTVVARLIAPAGNTVFYRILSEVPEARGSGKPQVERPAGTRNLGYVIPASMSRGATMLLTRRAMYFTFHLLPI